MFSPYEARNPHRVLAGWVQIDFIQQRRRLRLAIVPTIFVLMLACAVEWGDCSVRKNISPCG